MICFICIVQYGHITYKHTESRGIQAVNPENATMAMLIGKITRENKRIVRPLAATPCEEV